MTPSEFSTWLNRHCRLFGGLRAFLDKGGNELRDAWASQLRHLDAETAAKATDAMFGDEALQPHGFTKHPAALKRIAWKLRPESQGGDDYGPKLINGEWAVRCTLCRDEGHLDVVHSLVMLKAAQDGDKWDGNLSGSAAVACTCQTGNRWIDGKRYPMIRYDSADMVIHRNDDATEQEVRQWVEDRKGLRQPPRSQN